MCQNELTEFFAELTKFAAEISEFSLSKQCSRNSIPPVSKSSSAKDDENHHQRNQGPLNGGFQTGGFPDLDLSFLLCPFEDFPNFSGIFLICSGMVRGFSRFVLFLFLSLLIAPTRNSPARGLRHNLDLARQKWETARFGTPPL